MKAEVSLGISLATATVVYGIYQGALPPVVDVRAAQEHNTDVDAAEKLAGWTAAVAVAGISLLAKDMTVFIVGGSMVIGLSWWHRHANMVIPELGKAVPKTLGAHDDNPVGGDNTADLSADDVSSF